MIKVSKWTRPILAVGMLNKDDDRSNDNTVTTVQKNDSQIRAKQWKKCLMPQFSEKNP
jgi:hypothetical protein